MLLVYEGDDVDLSTATETLTEDSSDNEDINTHEYYYDTNFAYWKQYKKNNEDKYHFSQQEVNASDDSSLSPILKCHNFYGNLSNPNIHNDMLHLKLSMSNTSISSMDTTIFHVPPPTPQDDSNSSPITPPSDLFLEGHDLSSENTDLCFIDLGNCNFTTKYDTPDDVYSITSSRSIFIRRRKSC